MTHLDNQEKRIRNRKSYKNLNYLLFGLNNCKNKAEQLRIIHAYINNTLRGYGSDIRCKYYAESMNLLIKDLNLDKNEQD